MTIVVPPYYRIVCERSRDYLIHGNRFMAGFGSESTPAGTLGGGTRGSGSGAGSDVTFPMRNGKNDDNNISHPGRSKRSS